jgi:hypothetical protein
MVLIAVQEVNASCDQHLIAGLSLKAAMHQVSTAKMML